MTPSAQVAKTVILVELALPLSGGPFRASLFCEETALSDVGEPSPDVQYRSIAERDFLVSFPEVFAAIDDWLTIWSLCVPRYTWLVCESGPDAGVALLLEGRATPLLPGFLGHPF
nr:hypothetical protein [Mycolicibacterium sp. CBMA 213]